MNQEETFSIFLDGEEYVFKRNLTIGEDIKRRARRSQLCSGEFGNMIESKNMDEVTTALLADVITEIDIRLIKAPDSWKGAEFEGNDEKLMKLWREMAEKIGRFLRKGPEEVSEEAGETTEGESEGKA